MKTRVISGIVLVILLAITLLSGGYITAGVLLFVSLVAYHELAGALSFSGENGKIGLKEFIGYVVIVIHYLAMIITGGDLAFFVMMIMLLFFAEAAVLVFHFPKAKSEQMMFSVFSFVYAPLMLSFIYLLRIREAGEYLAWMPFVAWICDTAAYFAGSMFGKHKLCPNLSPKKTIEGAVGGVIGSVLAGVIFGYLFAVSGNSAISTGRTMVSFAIITFVAGILSQIGDLIASAIKRDRGIKDYGKLIPGHGGIMDRFDSVIFITPLIFFMAKYLL